MSSEKGGGLMWSTGFLDPVKKKKEYEIFCYRVEMGAIEIHWLN